MTNEARFIALETALAHQERLVDDLNMLVRQQADQLDLLQAQLRHLAGRLAATEDALPEAPEANAPPPHW